MVTLTMENIRSYTYLFFMVDKRTGLNEEYIKVLLRN